MVRVAALPDLAPGENARDSASGAAWSYLLPDRGLGTILTLGEPTPASLTTLRAIGREVLVLPAGHAIDTPWPVTDGGADLVAAIDPAWSSRLASVPGLASELERGLAVDGTLFARLGPDSSSATGTVTRPALPPGVTDDDLLWLGLRDGEIRGVVPAGDRALIELVTARWDEDREIRSRLRRIVRRLRGRRSMTPALELGAFRLPIWAGRVSQPPAYVRALASTAGLSLDEHRWALLDPGSYSTKKILLFLVGPGHDRPELVVKLVRDERFNGRLESAWEALSDLGGRAPDLAGLGPRPVFIGHHAGLALMAESVVEGVPLKRRLGDQPADPLVGTVVDRLVGLGIATADASVAEPSAIAAELGAMVERYSAIYAPAPAERAALAAAVDRIGASPSPVPLVLQHGDVGTWNVLIDPSGEPVLIDWEAAVPHGMPLWDVFYFARSAAVGIARRTGTRDALAGAQRHLFEDGPISTVLVKAVDRFCMGSGLDRSLVEPLFQLCWMHRALKASSTLSADGLARGHYRRLLKASIDGRDAPGLRRLFGESSPAAG
jgi:hypothetical protein